MSQPELFAEPYESPGHWLKRISDGCEMPQWVADALPDEPSDWVNWLVRAASLAKIYADCALAPLADSALGARRKSSPQQREDPLPEPGETHRRPNDSSDVKL